MWPQLRFIKHRSNQRSSFQKYALWFSHCRFNSNTSTCARKTDPRLFPHPRRPLICSRPWKNVYINGDSIPLLIVTLSHFWIRDVSLSHSWSLIIRTKKKNRTRHTDMIYSSRGVFEGWFVCFPFAGLNSSGMVNVHICENLIKIFLLIFHRILCIISMSELFRIMEKGVEISPYGKQQ